MVGGGAGLGGGGGYFTRLVGFVISSLLALCIQQRVCCLKACKAELVLSCPFDLSSGSCRVTVPMFTC